MIANTTTDSGLTVACCLDNNTYQKGIKVSDAEMATLTSAGTVGGRRSSAAAAGFGIGL
jgi:hypothetical protein